MRTATTSRSAVIGVTLIMTATLCFALGDVTTKYLAGRLPVPVVLAARYVVNLALIVVIFGPRLGSGLWQVRRRRIVLVRSLCLAVLSMTLVLALKRMPVGETIAIIYLSPFAVMLLSAPLLGEPVRREVWYWAVAGFVGVLIILRPGSGLNPLGAAFALINAGIATAYHLLTRLLSRTERTTQLQFNAAAVGTVLFMLWALPDIAGLHLGTVDLLLLAALGTAYTAGHFIFTFAYGIAPAAILAPVNYAHLVWAGGLGLVLFGEAPDPMSLAGIALVCLSGVAIALVARGRG